jgi:beta-glucosidase/6-phospho-beta-glucosidase/beta-galactosidase
MFKSFFLGGFECSTHRLRWGKRLDMIAATQHDTFVAQDYARLQAEGIYTVREGIRWHLIETSPGRYDWSSVLPMVRTARDMGMQVVWDLCHYGWPDDVNIFLPVFVSRFARFARAFARLLADETDEVPFVVPVNEISFFSWASGDAGYLNPFERVRSFEMKVQLVRAAIEAIEATWDVLPNARIVHVDPVINVVTDPSRPEERGAAEGHHEAQFQAWDMLAGRLWPLLGGDEKYLDIIGVNYYSNNQWVHGSPPMHRMDPLYRKFRHILNGVYNRYRRPLFVSETGIEGDERPDWLRYISEEVRAAVEMGVPVEGICLYPIVNHPGWDDERHCHNGLWDYPNARGEREIYQPLADELRQQRVLFEGELTPELAH